MNELNIVQAAALFNDIEKWSTFLDLYNNKEQFVDLWYSSLINSLQQKLAPDPKKWNFRKWQPRSWGWYTGSDQDSLVILYENNHFCLWINEGRYNVPGILSQFRDRKLFNGFFASPDVKNGGSFMAKQENAIVINNIKNPDIIAWYAGRKSPEYDQLLTELHRFFSFFLDDQEIYRMILEVNNMKK